MFRLTVLGITFLLSVLIAPVSSLAADGRPIPPAEPKSQEECRAYQRQEIEYARIAVQKSRECSARNQATNNEDMVLYPSSCGGNVLSAFRSCTELSDTAWCALRGLSEKMSACFEKASAAEQNRLTDALAQNEEQKKIETEKLPQGQDAVAEGDADDLRKSLQQRREGVSWLEPDVAAARRDVETRTAPAAKANDEASELKAAETSAAELRKSLQQEHDKNEALTRDLSMARAKIYAYEAAYESQAQQASGREADSRQAAENGAEELRKSLQQEQERASRLEQDLGAARREIETQAALAAEASAEAARLKQAAYDSSADSLRLLQQEREKTSRLERELASKRKTKKPVPAAAGVMTAGQVAQDKQPGAGATRPVAATQTTASTARDNAEAARLMARASALLGQGDIGSARIVLERVAETGNAQASFALAETYDPVVLRKWGAYGTLGDAAKALDLYARAQAGGINEAKERSAALRR